MFSDLKHRQDLSRRVWRIGIQVIKIFLGRISQNFSERERDRQTDRQTDRERETERDRERERERETERERERQRETDRQTDREINLMFYRMWDIFDWESILNKKFLTVKQWLSEFLLI
jgi:hypothetical protein